MFKLKVILYVQICHFREYRMCLLSQVRTMFDQEVTTVQLNRNRLFRVWRVCAGTAITRRSGLSFLFLSK